MVWSYNFILIPLIFVVHRKADGVLENEMMTESTNSMTREQLIEKIAEILTRIDELEDNKRELEQVKNQLQEREERYRTLFEAGRDAVFTLKDEVFVECNDRTLEVFGCEPGHIIGQSPYKFSPEFQPDGMPSRDKALEKIRNALDGEPQIFYWKHLRLDGIPFDAEVFLNRIKISGRTFIQAVVRDISRQKLAEEALASSEQKYRLLTEGLRDVVFKITLEGQLEYCSPAVTEFGGYNAEEEVGEFIYKYFAKRIELSRALQLLKNAAKDEVPASFEFLFMPKNKHPFPVEITSKPVNRGGKVVSLLCVMRDISERRLAEQEKQLLEEKLIQFEKMEAIGRLAGGVAHDLNNVLSAVVGYPDLLLPQLVENNPMYKPLLNIKRSGQKAAAIVEDLLTLARRGVRSRKVINLNDIVREYLSSPEFEQLKEHYPDIKFNIDLQENLNNIYGSPVHLVKALMNLVINAAEAMPEGGKITLSSLNLYPGRSASELELQDYVVLTVSDTGIGIPEEDKNRIFEPFYTRKVMGRSGTGLGMAVVWGTVQDHDGYINFQSRKDRGTTFELYFPATTSLDIEQDEDENEPLEGLMGRGQRVLVVDDDEEQREVTVSLLTRLDYKVQAVGSGEAAIDICGKEAEASLYDVVILDMLMGDGMDGLDTYKHLVDICPGVKVIIVSGFAETRRVKEAQKLGAGEYIKKPCTLRQLGRALKKALASA